jgi:hypothetical protein
MSRAMRCFTLCVVVLVVIPVLCLPQALGYVGGIVLDHQGAAVAGALVIASRIAEEEEDETSFEGLVYVDSAVTTKGGAYEVAVSPGEYELSVRAEGFTTKVRTMVVYTGITYVDPVEMELAGSISGTVYGSDGETAIAGALVIATSEAEEVFLAWTDAAGRFSVGLLPSGDYTLEAFSGTAFFLGIGPIAVGIGESVEEQAFAALPGDTYEIPVDSGTIVGHVYFELGGEPAVGAAVFLERQIEDDLVRQPLELYPVPPAEDGSFVALGVPAGSYRVNALVEGHAIAFVDEVEVSAGTETADIVIRVHPPAGVIRGIATDAATGMPLAEAIVMATSISVSQYAIAGEDGAFVLEFLPEGTYDVWVVAEEYDVSEFEGVEVRAGEASPILNAQLEEANNEE